MGELDRLAVAANLASTLVMVGVVWFVQAVHYPLFARVGAERFVEYAAAHVRATTRVVGPPMLVEAATSAILAWRPPAPELAIACRIGLLLVVLIWASTAILQVPRHRSLGAGFDAKTLEGLVRTNWLRTAGWSARGVLVLYLVVRLL